MSDAVAIGDARRLAGYGLAGVEVIDAATAAEIDAAWTRVDADTRLLLLTPETYEELADRLGERGRLIWAVVPS